MIPPGYDLITVTDSAADMRHPFLSRTNARVVPRTLTEDFNALAAALKGRMTLNSATGRLSAELSLNDLAAETHRLDGPAKNAAAFIAEEDMRPLTRHFRALNLYVVGNYQKNGEIYMFHADPSDVVACTYRGAVTEYIRNSDVAEQSDHPYGSAYIYTPKDGAHVYSFNNGDLWCQEGWQTQGPKRAFVHRAPDEKADPLPRLLLLGVRR